MSQRHVYLLSLFAVSAVAAGACTDEYSDGFGGSGSASSGATTQASTDASSAASTNGSTSGGGGMGGASTSSAATSTASSTTGATTVASSASSTASASASSSSGGPTMENTDVACSDAFDNDMDMAVDCKDIECKAPMLTACAENCSNDFDDDGDGAEDCDDITCNGDNGGAVAGVCATTEIQEIQDGTLPTMTDVRVRHVWVTGVRTAANGNVTIWVQEPQGQTPPSHKYPEFAGVSVFATAATAAQFPAFMGLTTGACVDFAGTTQEFSGRTQVSSLTSFELSSNCGTAPTPFSIPTAGISFANIATDTNAFMSGDQPGTLTETYEGVLLKVTGVSNAMGSNGDPTGDFRVQTGIAVNPSTLLIDKFLFGMDLPTGNYSQITGVYDQFGNFRLQPRTAADLMP